MFYNLYPKTFHNDVIKWKHFLRYWPFVQGIHRSPVNSPHKDQWRGALMFSLICVWRNGWVNNREAGDLRWYRAHYDVNVIVIGNHQGINDRNVYANYTFKITATFLRGQWKNEWLKWNSTAVRIGSWHKRSKWVKTSRIQKMFFCKKIVAEFSLQIVRWFWIQLTIRHHWFA